MRKNIAHNRSTAFKAAQKYWRIYTLVFFVLVCAGAIFARLFVLQVQGHGKYLDLAENQHKILKELTPRRGDIFMAEKNELYPLATNREMQMAYAVPQEIGDMDKTVAFVSETLGIEKTQLWEKFSDKDDLYEVLKHKITAEEEARIKENNLPGIKMMPEDFRYYPGGELASQVVGFVGSDGENFRGMYGIEAFWDQELRGETGNIRQERDTRGRWISIADREIEPAKNGDTLILTINHTVQYEVEKILKETVEKHGAESGSVIAMEVKTGKILAMASWPSFNPNDYAKVEDISAFLNPAISSAYECGSAFKPITMAAGIDDGKIEPDTTYVDTGSVKEAGYTIKNSEEKVYGKKTMTNVLETSINTGVIYVEKLVGNKKFYEYVRDFGFGQKSGITLPSESAGDINNLEELQRDIHFFTASFGQGITVTPLQLVNAYAAIGNKGRLMKPQIVDKIIKADGSEEQTGAEELRQVISEETARKVSQMLRSVVVNGHGKRADVPGYLVAGKTGTAQVSKVGEKGYDEGLTIGTFAGFAPMDDAQFAVLVKVYDPKDVQWAESTAAPAFSKVMKFLLEYYGVKPTE